MSRSHLQKTISASTEAVERDVQTRNIGCAYILLGGINTVVTARVDTWKTAWRYRGHGPSSLSCRPGNAQLGEEGTSEVSIVIYRGSISQGYASQTRGYLSCFGHLGKISVKSGHDERLNTHRLHQNILKCHSLCQPGLRPVSRKNIRAANTIWS